MRVFRNAWPIAFTALLGLAACSGATPPTAPDALPPDPSGPVPVGAGVMGQFVPVRYAVNGTATLAIESGVARLDFSADFTIANTPGPVVYLNTTNNPNSGQPIRVAPLRSRSGAQRYTFQVPAGVRYTWVIIWCDPFNVPMAEAAIPPTP